mmetsp:Transcript_97305/g.290678  ORF Transcript_97305/g.290678 Transcript_97305/m.290678 type:complete len:95 (-) Transcript_97305:640-924(-)
MPRGLLGFVDGRLVAEWALPLAIRWSAHGPLPCTAAPPDDVPAEGTAVGFAQASRLCSPLKLGRAGTGRSDEPRPREAARASCGVAPAIPEALV